MVPTEIDFIHSTMSMDRFLFLMRCLRFDDINDRAQSKELDKLAPVRELFTIFVQNCQNAYTISEYSTIDEQLVPFRAKCPFRQYIPIKPAKYRHKNSNFMRCSNLVCIVNGNICKKTACRTV